jgi:hypothetical protein
MAWLAICSSEQFELEDLSEKAMRGRIALQKHFVQNPDRRLWVSLKPGV